MKRDTPSSLSNLHHQTANASTNTPIHENLSITPFLTSPITNKSASTELSGITVPMKITSPSSSSLTTTTIGTITNKINKNPQDSSSFNFNLRQETNQESTPNTEKKTFIVSFIFNYLEILIVFNLFRIILCHHQ